jgi:hypothetical protein
MLTRDPAADADAVASATHGLGHDVKLDDIGMNRTAAAARHAESVGAHSSQAVGRAGLENLPDREQRAGPRAARQPPAAPQTQPPRRLPAPPGLRCRAASAPSGRRGVVGIVRGSDETVRAGIASPLRWPGTSGRCASGATVLPAGDKSHRSTGPDSASGETAGRSPSTGSAAVETENRHLESAQMMTDTEVGPREFANSQGQASKRS